MFENDAKGWHGSYSIVGKNSAQKYPLVLHKDEILNKEYKKNKNKTIFTPEESIDYEDYNNTLEMLKIYNREEKLNNSNDEENLNLKKEFLNQEKYKFHNIHMKKLDKKKNNSVNNLIRYYPKYDYIYPKILTGPSWKFLKGRTNSQSKENNNNNSNINNNKNINKKNINININNTINSEENYYDINYEITNYEDYKNNKIKNDKKINKYDSYNDDLNILSYYSPSKCLVNMDKTTQRGEFTISHDIRIRTDKPFNKSFIKYKKNKKLLKKSNLLLFQNKIKKIKISKLSKIKIQNDSLSNNNIANSISTYKKKINLKYKTQNNSKKNLIKTIDFDKIMSREQIDKIKNKKIKSIPFIFPNYNLVTDRTISKVIYSKPNENKRKIKIMKGIDSLINYNPDKIINKIDNHSETKVPNFSLMNSRYDNKNKSKLPIYMQNLHDRKSVDSINEKSLKLNNFSNSKFLNPSNSFWPKRSYNNIVNLNLLKNKSLNYGKYKDESLEKQKNILKTELNFFYKDKNELIKEGALKRFDNITFKTICRKVKDNLNKKEIEKIIKKYEKLV